MKTLSRAVIRISFILSVCTLLPVKLMAVTPVTSVNTNNTTEPGSTSYTVGSTVFTFGNEPVENRTISGFEAGGTDYNLFSVGVSSVFRRNNNQFTAFEREIVFYENTRIDGGNSNDLRPNHVTTMEEALLSDTINRGSDNVFENVNSANTNNIERIDVLFAGQLLSPQSLEQLSVGFGLFERGGNDNIGIAAITAIDSFGNPTQYSNIVALNSGSSTWGDTGIRLTSTVFNSGATGSGPNGEWASTASVGAQNITGTLVTLNDLGISVGEQVYGYSLFAGDTVGLVGSSNDLLDWQNQNFFPTNTGSANGGADLIGGGLSFAPEGVDLTGLITDLPEPGSSTLIFLGLSIMILLRKR